MKKRQQGVRSLGRVLFALTITIALTGLGGYGGTAGAAAPEAPTPAVPEWCQWIPADWLAFVPECQGDGTGGGGEPAGPVEEQFSEPGPWAVTSETVNIAGIGVESFLHYPADLGADGYRHPILTWGTGAGGDTETYADTFEHLASWGYVVVAPHEPAQHENMVTATEWLLARDGDPSSVFHESLDTEKVAALGHSQGAGNASVAVGNNTDLYSTLVPISFTDRWTHSDTEGVEALSNMGNIPVFFVAGSADFLVSQGDQELFFDQVPGAAARAAVVGGDHNVIQQTDNAMQPFITAWLKYTLEGDKVAREAFAGDSPEILTRAGWTWRETKNLP